jgi:dynein heavy chain
MQIKKFIRYEKLKPTIGLFDEDIGKYTQISTNVQVQETVVSVHFLEINSDRLKAAIVDQCIQWQQKLTGLLLRLTESKVHHIYKYIAYNGKRYSSFIHY